jgi:hypothetical protein
MKHKRCIRCEALERPQQSKMLYSITNQIGDTISLCAVCVIEIKEEEDYFKNEIEEDESRSENFDEFGG